MRLRRSRPNPFFIAAILISVCVGAPSGFSQTPPAGTQTPPATTQAAPASQSLTEAELKKIDGLIAQQGRDIAVTPIITEILGLTKGDQTMTCHAFAAVGDGNEVHQIYLLPDGKGYLASHFYKDKVDVYSVDKSFALVAALEGISGKYPAPTSFADAQYGYNFEVAWWAKYADTH
jgi:hypothetical protein